MDVIGTVESYNSSNGRGSVQTDFGSFGFIRDQRKGNGIDPQPGMEITVVLSRKGSGHQVVSWAVPEALQPVPIGPREPRPEPGPPARIEVETAPAAESIPVPATGDTSLNENPVIVTLQKRRIGDRTMLCATLLDGSEELTLRIDTTKSFGNPRTGETWEVLVFERRTPLMFGAAIRCIKALDKPAAIFEDLIRTFAKGDDVNLFKDDEFWSGRLTSITLRDDRLRIEITRAKGLLRGERCNEIIVEEPLADFTGSFGRHGRYSLTSVNCMLRIAENH